jgi:transmembrane sensor
VSVRAVGTEFVVQIGPQQVEVLVTEGQVAVERDKVSALPSAATGVTASAASSTLAAGQLAVVDRAAESAKSPRVTEISEGERAQRLAWRAPRLEFTRTPLRDAVALLNEHGGGGVRFIIADAELAEVRVGGLFRADQTEAFVELLRTGFGISVEERGRDRVLRKTH